MIQTKTIAVVLMMTIATIGATGMAGLLIQQAHAAGNQTHFGPNQKIIVSSSSLESMTTANNVNTNTHSNGHHGGFGGFG